ncbi:MAG: DnaJ domain-containing protein [Gammaproteobacteria bacterium]|nr:DnaJ domain-containing protein [Gammaproteobacteria bacterium]
MSEKPHQDYYSIMGLSRDASEKDIKMAYRRLARKYHPDLNKEADAEENFKALGQAYEVLKDKTKRAAYDQYGEHWEQPQHAQQQSSHQSHHYQQQSGGPGFDMDDDFLASLFGHRRQAHAPQAGQDYHANITLTLEEAFKGTTRQMDIPLQHIGADGQIVTHTQPLKVNIPAGVKQGQKIRVPEQGAAGVNKGPRGHLYLTIHFHKHHLYEVKERNIYLTLPITPWEAALGTTIKTPTLAGPVDLKIPPGSQSAQKLRLKGRGLPGKTPGDQLIILKVIVPPADSEAAKKLYEDMAQTMAFNPRTHLGV